jgi:hypothetical protein
LLVKNGDDEINTPGDPDLGFHGVGRGAVVMLDAQVLLEESPDHV